MKYLKLLGLAGVTAMALTAFLGSGSASATVLCKTSLTSGCWAAGWNNLGDTLYFTPEETIRLTDTSGDTLNACIESGIEMIVKNVGSSTTTLGAFADITFDTCSVPTATLGTGELEIHWIAGTDNGAVTGKKFDWTMTLFGTSCEYGLGTGTHIGTLTGGSPAIIDISSIVTKTAGGFICPSTAIWEGKYISTHPSGTIDIATS